MLSKKVRTLIERLHEKTTDHKLTWDHVSWGDAFETSLAGFVVILARGADDPNYPRAAECFRLRVVDDTGTDVTAVVLSPDEHGAHERFYHLTKKMFAAAHESTSGSDEAIDTILAALDEI